MKLIKTIPQNMQIPRNGLFFILHVPYSPVCVCVCCFKLAWLCAWICTYVTFVWFITIMDNKKMFLSNRNTWKFSYHATFIWECTTCITSQVVFVRYLPYIHLPILIFLCISVIPSNLSQAAAWGLPKSMQLSVGYTLNTYLFYFGYNFALIAHTNV